MSQTPDIAIIGAGAGGLATARRFHAAGVPAVLFEAGPSVGGSARTLVDGPWRAEWGPNTLAAGADTVKLFREWGIAEVLIEAAPAARKRFLVKDGQPSALPVFPPKLFFSNLFSKDARRALWREAWQPRRDPSAGEESVADFVRRRLDDEWLRRAVGPFVSGVYAGDPERLSVAQAFPRMVALEETHGSLVRGAIKARGTGRKMYSSSQGMSGLMQALASALPDVRTDTAVSGILPADGANGKRFRLRLANGEELAFRDVILTVSGTVASRLLEPFARDVADRLWGVEYPTLAVVHHGYRREDVAHPLDGFGMLIPREEGFETLGTLFPSAMFTGRAPEGHVLLTSFIGGAFNPSIANQPVESVIETVLQDAQKLLGIAAAPVWTNAYVVPRAIPQYNLGHGAVVEAVRAAEARHPGLWLRGNYVDGIALADRLNAGAATAGQILARDAK